MDPITRKFTFSDGQGHDVTIDETSEPLQSCQDYKWSITPNTQLLVGGPPLYTIEVSNDGSSWFEYNSESTDITTDNAVCDDHLAFTQMRIVHKANGSTSGNVEYIFVQKYN